MSKYGTKNFSDLSIGELNKIQNHKISSLAEISDTEIKTFLDPESLTNTFIPLPPAHSFSLEQIDSLIKDVNNIEEELLRKLKWMHLVTYYYGGQVFFRNSEKIGVNEIFYTFSNEPNNFMLNRENPEIKIDGEVGLRSLWLLNMSSSENLFLSPSISLNIEIDNQPYFKQSVAVSPIVNRVINGFGEMKISLSFENDDIDNNIYLSYY